MAISQRAIGILAFAALVVFGGAAEASQDVSEAALPLRFALKNGLECILSEDYTLPVVAVVVAYKAGSIQEPEGKTGLAYLMEKLMMDAGSENVAPFQHRNTIIRAGGVLDAEALEDRTLFYETVPAHLLAHVLWLESERMRSLAITTDSFERARASLLEELRQRRSTEPYLASLFTLDQLIYSDFAYSHSLLGSENDVRNLTLEDVRAFAANYFTPTNAVLVIAGHCDRPKTRDLISKYFEAIPRGKDLRSAPAGIPAGSSRQQISLTYEEPLVSTPALYVAFRIPPAYSNDDYTLVILDYVLLRGRTSRLPRRLLNRDAKIAYQVSGGIERRLDRAVYKIFVTASPPMIPTCQEAIFNELDKLKRGFLPADELARAKTLYRLDLVVQTSTAADRAIYLAGESLALGLVGRTVDNLPEEQAKCLAVSEKDIVGIVNRHFTVENSVVLQIKRK
jgi:zinc protease